MPARECNCGNYRPYHTTLIQGRVYGSMMPLRACVNCYPQVGFDEGKFKSAMEKVHELREDTNESDN